jgi:glycosidase
VDATEPGAYLVSEEWQDASHYLVGDTYSATMNYRFAWAVRGLLASDALRPSEFDDRLQVWMRDTPPPALKCQMNLVDSHDTDRILHACKGDTRKLRQIATFQLAFPGAPMIYYGDETALNSDFDHPADGRRTMPWGNLDRQMIGYYKRAIAFHKQSAALRVGEVETVVIDDAQRVYAFARRADNEVVYAIFNASDVPVEATIPLAAGEEGRWIDALELNPTIEARGGGLHLQLPARGMAWYARA